LKSQKNNCFLSEISRFQDFNLREDSTMDALTNYDPIVSLACAVLRSCYADLHLRKVQPQERRRTRQFLHSKHFERMCHGLDLDPMRWRQIILTGRFT